VLLSRYSLPAYRDDIDCNAWACAMTCAESAKIASRDQAVPVVESSSAD
jgi:hypothetical protein